MVVELPKPPTTEAPHLPPPQPAQPAALLPLFTKSSRNLSCLLTTSLVSTLFVLTFSSSFTSRSSMPFTSTTTSPQISLLSFSSLPLPPSLAYLITGSDGDHDRVIRLLFSIYHPKNHYLLHLDLDARQEERYRLALTVQEVDLFRKIGNVHVVGKAGFANTRGSSALAVLLHGAALFLRLEKKWDWFVNLDASDYPLVTQDDLLHILAFLPRDLNFIQHTSHFEPKELRRLKPVTVDPTLVSNKYSKSDAYFGTQRRQLPTSFHLFTGSPFVFLSRKFIEYSILGTDNFPRTLLMYLANAPSSHTKYFHTLLCNTAEFKTTVYNGNFHFVLRDATQEDDPSAVGVKMHNMTQSGAAFGFSKNDNLLNLIDQELLNRLPGNITSGGWCLGSKDPCAVMGDANILRPGPGAKRLEKMVVKFLSNGDFHTNQCVLE